MCWVRHRPPVPIMSWWGPLQWVIPLQPSIRSAGQSFFSLILCCCCSSSGCNIGLLWFPRWRNGLYFFLGWHHWWMVILDHHVGSDYSHTRAHLWSSTVFWTGFFAVWQSNKLRKTQFACLYDTDLIENDEPSNSFIVVHLTKIQWLIRRKSKLSTSNKILIYKAMPKPIWPHEIQLWGTAFTSYREILERF
jgi:hypothetical protein